ncbi:hypothetical protein SAMN05421770_101886 [Granulicella rosea]|uniref:Lipoprotein n=1 Tax=Granulicella rosea TaxID=474952 RepID=A0A239ED47_9BACT|nr:hypothetical protein [Granulicella rosea]SNS41812.1 hypothetical protein SAMN05421770_101886 [Granulicella rosea]
MHTRFVRTISIVGAPSLALLLAGCAGITSILKVSPVPVAGAAVHGAVHGGQQPISGATIQLFIAGTGGYAQTNKNILTSVVTTGLDGSFTLSGNYPCTPGQRMYLVATGGYPAQPASQGGAPNPNAAVMAALGDCGSLTTSTFINMNEVTTVGSVFALAPFMSGYTNLGANSGNVAGLNRAFASVNKLVDIGAGSSTGSALPAGATGPSSEINTLADAMAVCINSAGGTAGDSTGCGMFFSYATPPGGAAPTDTIAALLNLAHNPFLHPADL